MRVYNTGTRTTFELDRDEPLLQTLGAVVTKAGRCIAFPNIYQHRVSPFALEDRTRPGHRKILALFLVDPNRYIPSTAIVAPQQRLVLSDELVQHGPESRLHKLPVELIDMVVQSTDEGTMSREEAFNYREELMDERTEFVRSNNDTYFAVPFNMCEH